MKYLLLLILSSHLLTNIQGSFRPYKQEKKYLSFRIAKKNYQTQNWYLFRSILTGNKSGLDRRLINTFKKYGVIHILTPSGLHLSSILIFINGILSLQLFLLPLLFYYLNSFESYHAMERVIMFQIAGLFQHHLAILKNIEVRFLITIISSFFIGQFTRSPLSLIFSFIFWGTIIIFRDQKLKCVIFLHFTLLFINSLLGQTVNPLSLFLNPLLTFVFTLSFPLLFTGLIFSKLDFLHKIINEILSIQISLIELIDQYNFIPNYSPNLFILLLAILSFQLRWYKGAVLILLLNITTLNTPLTRMAPTKIYNIGHPSELMKVKRNKYYFVDQNCLHYETSFTCKLSSNRFGGVQI